MTMTTNALREILSFGVPESDVDLLVRVISPLVDLAQENDVCHQKALEALMSALSLSRSPADSFTETTSIATLYLRACCLGMSSSVVRRFLSTSGKDWEELALHGDAAPIAALINTLKDGLRDRSEEWLTETAVITQKAIARFCPDCSNPWDHEPLFGWRESHPRIEVADFAELHQLLGD